MSYNYGFRTVLTENDRIFIYGCYNGAGNYSVYESDYNGEITDSYRCVTYDIRDDSISTKNVIVTKDDSEYVLQSVRNSSSDSYKLDIRKVQGYQSGELILSIDRSDIFNQSDWEWSDPIRTYDIVNPSIQSISHNKITITVVIQLTVGSEYPYTDYSGKYSIAIDLSLRTYKNLGIISEFRSGATYNSGILIV